jgi:hypothetical protein
LTDAENVLWRDTLIVGIKINIRVLWTLYHATLVNEAMRSLLPNLSGLRSRIQRSLELSNTLIYPQELDQIIDYWSEVYSPYPGGPVIINYVDVQRIVRNGGGELQASVGTPTSWVAQVDLDGTGEFAKLLNDIEVALGVLTRYDCNDANDATDLRLIQSLYSMMGFPTPQTGVKGLTVNPVKYFEQFKRYGFLYVDDKGAGTDTWVYWPDIRGDQDSLVDIRIGDHPFDVLDMIGAKGVYAFDADDDDNPGYTAKAADLTAYGMAHGSNWLTASLGSAQVPTIQAFTKEDAWVEIATHQDITSAAGLQLAFWANPVRAMNPDWWRIIMSEEAEEAYKFALESARHVQIPFDHFGQAFRRWIYAAYKIPYIT